MTFYLKHYEVVVTGYGSGTFYAKSKNQARWKAFSVLNDLYVNMLFKDFLKLHQRINEVPAPEGFGRQILVLGKPAHWVGYDDSGRIKFTRPHRDIIRSAHKSDVEELPSTPPVEGAQHG